MRAILRFLHKAFVILLISILIFTPSGKSVRLLAVDLSAGKPDLIIVRPAALNPVSPMVGEPVTVEVVVENASDFASTQARVSLDWCCSGMKRDLPAIDAHGSVSVKFMHALVFNHPGTYELTVTVDCDLIVDEESEANNTKKETVNVRLRQEAFVGDPQKWGEEMTAQTKCPETDLFKIGRKVPLKFDDLCPGVWGQDHGCPKIDKDGDGRFESPSWILLDKNNGDDCPDEPGPGGESKGCPAAGVLGDRDGDGVFDTLDSCPDKWGPASNNGCPSPDRDGDGVSDASDRCPDVPGPSPEGCPIYGTAEDTDGDGFFEDRLSRVCDKCGRDDDQEKDLGCQVFLRGQRDNACGTTSLAYILRYFGKDVWPDDVDRELRGTKITDMFSEPMGLRDYARSCGLNSEIYVNGDIDELRNLVERGIPVMLDISNTAGSKDVYNGHWVVVLSMCGEPSSVSPGTMDTVIQMYDPGGVQFSITPDRLEQFWGDMELWGVDLWSRLYLAVYDEPLPVGNTDDVSEKIAIARGIAQVMSGLDDIAEGNVIDGLVGLGGGVVSGILGLIGTVLSWGEDIPIIGGVLGALGDFCGNVAQAVSKITDGIGDLFDYETWSDPSKLGAAFLNIIEGIADAIVAFFEMIWDSIVGFFESIIDWVKDLGCDWFGWWCPDIVTYYKHFVSSDPCLETTIFINETRRVEALGYLYTYPAPDTKPVWLYSATSSAIKIPLQANEGLAVGDVNGDGRAEIIHGDRSDDKIYIFDLNGNLLSEPFNVGYEDDDRIAVGDVDGDGKDEIVLADESEDNIFVFTMYGTGLVGAKMPDVIDEIQPNEGLAVGDVNGDGRAEIIHGDRSDDKIYIFDLNGNLLSEPFNVGYEDDDRIAVGDVDGDGKDEIVLADESEDWINIFDMNGNMLKKYIICDSADLSAADSNFLNLGVVGYTLKTDTGNLDSLSNFAQNHGIGVKGDVGYLLKEPQEGTEILWLMQSLTNRAFWVSTDKCALTQTFLSPIAKLYTRESAVCMIPNSETPGAVKLYRYYNERKEDCLLSTFDGEIENFLNQGYLGYIYTEQRAGTVPLYQFYNSKRDDHFISLDINAEGLSGYGSYEILGYVMPPSRVVFDDWKCNVPLWRFCKRVIKEE